MSIDQTTIDSLRGELREEKEVVAALHESKADAERLLSKKIGELVALQAKVGRLETALEECCDGSGTIPTDDPQLFQAGVTREHCPGCRECWLAEIKALQAKVERLEAALEALADEFEGRMTDSRSSAGRHFYGVALNEVRSRVTALQEASHE